MIPGSQKSRQNHDEYRKMKWEASRVLHPNVQHSETFWAEEKVFSKSGKEYIKYHPLNLQAKS